MLFSTCPSIEMLFLDDGSSDDIEPILKRLSHNPRVRIYRQPNQKLPRALTHAHQFARGQFITWTSADNLLMPLTVERLVDALLQNPPAVMVYAHVSLIDEHGYFHRDCNAGVSIAEVETELRAQIDRAYAMGLEPTHLDSHMGCLFQSPELIAAYLKMGQEYKLPVLVNRQFPQELLDQYEVKVVMEDIMTINPSQYAAGVEDYYTGAIKSLKPGLSTLLIHTAYDNQETQGMTEDHPDWGSAWRQADMDFFTSGECANLLEKENVHLVTWRQVKSALFQSQ